MGPFTASERFNVNSFGTTFQFTARDEDGLPVVAETFEDRPRVASFEAMLHKVQPGFEGDDWSLQFDDNPKRMPIK